MYAIKELDGVSAAFPTTVKGFMPEYKDLPKEYTHGDTKWHKLVADMFFCGLKKLDLKPREGVDPKKAMRHIRYVLGSWEPKHEHKTAGVAWLLNEWFEDGTWEVADRKAQI